MPPALAPGTDDGKCRQDTDKLNSEAFRRALEPKNWVCFGFRPGNQQARSILISRLIGKRRGLPMFGKRGRSTHFSMLPMMYAIRV